jgi:hypothetical protein
MNPQAPPQFGYGYAPGGTPFYTPESVQSIIDNEHLRLLRIGYFISAGQTAILIPLGLFYAAMGIFVAHFPAGTGAPTPPLMPLFFGIFGSVITGIAAVASVLKLLTGMRLKERKGRLLCLITAGLSLFEIPYGTALGLMTFIVLARPAVRQQFDRSG